MRVTRMVWRPYHGPGVDVEELAPTAWPVAVIAHSAGVMRRLQLVPVKRDRPVRTVWDQGQSAQNVVDRDNVDDRLWLLLIEELGSSVGHLPPPDLLPPAGWGENLFRLCYLIHWQCVHISVHLSTLSDFWSKLFILLYAVHNTTYNRMFVHSN